MFVRRIIPLCIVLLLCTMSVITAFEVVINGNTYRDYSDTELNSMISTLPAGLIGDAEARGIPVSRLFPSMYEIWRIQIVDRTIYDDSLADRLAYSYLFKTGDGWSIALDDGQIFHDLAKVTVSGEALHDDALEVWISWEGEDELKVAIQSFADMQGIDISVLHIPNPESRLLAIVRGGGTPPDIIMCSPGKIRSLIEAEALQPLPDSLTANLNEQGLQNFSSSGKQWALPFYYDTQLIFYNPGLIDLGRNDELTLTALEREATALTGTVEVPMSWNAYSSYWLMPFQASFGKPSLLEADGSITIDDAETLQALEYIVELADTPYFTPLEKDAMISFFAAGRTAVIYSASYSIPYFSELGIPFAVAPQLINDQTGLPVSPMLDFKAFGITRRSRHPVLSYRLLSYLTSIDIQGRFCEGLSKLPANDWASALLEGQSPYYRTLTDQVGEGQTVPSSPDYGTYKNIMWKLIRFALSGQMDPGQVLESGERLLRQSSN